MSFANRRRSALLSGVLLCLTSGNLVSAADKPSVSFDLPSVVIAQPVRQNAAPAPLTGGRLIRIVVPVSTYLSSGFRGEVKEYLVELKSPLQTLRVIDVWPRQEVYSEVEGTIQVESKHLRESEVNVGASGGFEPFARGTVGGKVHENNSTHESYQRKPPLQVLTSSGTLQRGYGAFFKFRSGPALPNSEGVRDIALLAEVPASWRADVLQVSLSAVGSQHRGGRDRSLLGAARLWTTLHLEGDRLAAERARLFVRREQALRHLAEKNHQRVMARSLPTIWHRVGAALDVVEPRIRGDYLTQVIFGPSGGYLDEGNQRLPVDLRVAILDFWDARDELISLSHGRTLGRQVDSTSVTMSRTVN